MIKIIRNKGNDTYIKVFANLLWGLALVVYMFPVCFLLATYLDLSINMVFFMYGFVPLCVLFADKKANFFCSIPILGMTSSVYIYTTWGAGALMGATLFSSLVWVLTVLILSSLKKDVLFKIFSNATLSGFYVGLGLIFILSTIPFLIGNVNLLWNFTHIPMENVERIGLIGLGTSIVLMLILPQHLRLGSPLGGFLCACIASLFFGYHEEASRQFAILFSGENINLVGSYQELFTQIKERIWVAPVWNSMAVLLMSAVALYTAIDHCALCKVNSTLTREPFYFQFSKHSLIGLGLSSFLCIPFGGFFMQRSPEVYALRSLGVGGGRTGVMSACIIFILFSLIPNWTFIIGSVPPVILGTGLLLVGGYIICMGVSTFPLTVKTPSLNLVLLSIFSFSLLFTDQTWTVYSHVNILWILLVPMLFIQLFLEGKES